MRAAPPLAILVALLNFAPCVAATEHPAASYLPADALAAVVIRDGDRRVEALRDWVESLDLEESELYRKLESNPEFMQGKFAVMGFMAAAGVDPWKAVGAAFGRELAVGLVRGEPGKPQVILAMAAREPALVDRLLKSIHTLAGLERDGKPDEARSKEIDGVRVFSLAPNVYHCRVNDALLVSNSRELMKSAIESRAKSETGLARSAKFADAEKRVPKDALVWAFVDAKAVRTQLPADAKPDGPRDNPLGGFLLGAWWHVILHSESAVAWATADAKGVTLEASVVADEPLPKSYRGFAPQKLEGPTWSATDLPRFLSEIQVSRGWAELFSEREALLTTSGASQALQFTSTMSTLFGGMDFLNDVLPKLNAPTRFIIARQDFSKSEIVPSPKLPAFAIVQPVKTQAAAEFAQRLGSATQMALSLLSLDNAQKNLPTYLIDVDRYRGQRIVFSTFSAPPSTSGMKMDAEPRSPERGSDTDVAPDGAASSKPENDDSASVRYNFLPAAAVVEGQYIVATSQTMLQDIIDRILNANDKAKAGAKAAAELVDSFSIDAPSLVTILRENRDELVINRMLEESESKAQAQTAIDTFLGILEYTRGLRFTSRVEGNEYRAAIALTLREPKKANKP